MINRNKKSAVARAQAEMKQAVNSSRRPLDSARIGRTKEVKVIQGNYGYGWDDLVTYDKDDYAECKRDLHDYCINEPHANHRVIFRRVPNPDYVEKEKVVDESVEVSSSRHLSYKTRKAVEYSINCARRRARYGR